MKVNCYSMYDEKAEVYHAPMYSPNDAHIQRRLAMDLKNEGSVFNQFPEDFKLYHIGEFNDADGIITSVEPKRFVTEISALIVD